MSATAYRFIHTGVQDAALNMAIDEAILLHHIEEKVPPTLRVFQWKQPAISLGRFQNVEREIEQEVCARENVAMVRRPTGGRAVYHRDEFTYSITIGKREGVPSGVVAAYAYLLQGLIQALQHLGLNAIISDERVSKTPSAACFASSTQADLTVDGFKLIGSAQVWKEASLLQQGSLPLGDRAAEFFSLLRFPSEEARSQALAQYNTKTAPLNAFAPQATWDEVAQAFRLGFSSFLEHEFVPGELLPSEWDLARQLVAEKYSHLTWRKEKVTLIEHL
ncbi:octanoyltransferase LipM [Ktedonobacter sp. SOSP1-85]|uniref:lipoate--protein ligase family protein n=1 Tax=Ktedonobacter sp. SOSP1-85 TaxID=2778367 RepID=UPI001915AF68|nr:biotin/lipoate A/B protein ligase family protein [Ktedonobacter sp. SOSP1-85]GHO75448.1 octanoyltransferase LipM [Ktedonobacter sp. SOSP1-85]